MAKSSLARAIEKRWYGKAGPLLLLKPLAFAFGKIAQSRKHAQVKKAKQFSVPVIVVGNITVGGTGKTPTIITLVKFLQAKGLRPGVVSRGYGRKADDEALCFAHCNDSPDQIGDEPALIYRATQCALAVSADRVAAVQALIDQCQCDVILADDGLQHYRLYRDAEIAIVDGLRQFGNGHLLPVGPLRELPERLNECRWVLINGEGSEHDVDKVAHSAYGDGKAGQQIEQTKNAQEAEPAKPRIKNTDAYKIAVRATGLTHIVSGDHFGLEKLQDLTAVRAIAGIGQPEKFFTTLKNLGLRFEPCPFPDHHHYTKGDLAFDPNSCVLMTEKDAVKCRGLVGDNAYFLTISMAIPPEFLNDFYEFIVQQQRLKKL